MVDQKDDKNAFSWELTSKISPFLDLHMMFPLLEFIDTLISNGTITYSASDVAAARMELLKPTHMVDYAIEMFRESNGPDAPIPPDMELQKKIVFDKIEELRTGCKALDDTFRNETVKSKLVASGEWNTTSLCKRSELSISPAQFDTYRSLSKFRFDCGDYKAARVMISNIISLYAVAPLPKETAEEIDDTLDDERNAKSKDQSTPQNVGNPLVYYVTSITLDILNMLWGNLACEILVQNWEDASVALTAVRTAIDYLSSSNQITALDALKQRTWLLHWSLFVFWNNSGSKGLESMVDLFTAEKYLQAITTKAPHLLRYLTAAVLLCKRRVAKSTSKDGRSSSEEARKLMKNLIRVMQNCQYSDPIVEFVDCLCVKFDFEGAQEKLAECEKVLSTDFFLCKQTSLFMEEARVFVFENYCRIHNKIDLGALGSKLAMDQESAERWIVDLIRNALLDAKIDSETGCVVMRNESLSIYEQVMEKTRDLNQRSAALVQGLGHVERQIRRVKVKMAKAAMEEE